MIDLQPISEALIEKPPLFESIEDIELDSVDIEKLDEPVVKEIKPRSELEPLSEASAESLKDLNQ